MKLATYRMVSATINKEIADVLARHGLKVRKQGASVDELHGLVFLKIEAADVNLTDATGASTSPERELYKRNCFVFDLAPEWLDQTFTLGGAEYRVAGLRNTRGNKVVSIVRTRDEKSFIIDAESVSRAFVAQTARRAS